MTPCAPGTCGRESGEAFDRRRGFAAGGGDPFDVEDDAPVHVVGACGDEDELGAPCGVAVAFEMQRCIGFGPGGEEFAGAAVEALVAGLGFEQWCDDFAVRVQHPGQIGMGPRAGTVGIEEPEFAGLVGSEFAMQRARVRRGSSGSVR